MEYNIVFAGRFVCISQAQAIQKCKGHNAISAVIDLGLSQVVT